MEVMRHVRGARRLARPLALAVAAGLGAPGCSGGPSGAHRHATATTAATSTTAAASTKGTAASTKGTAASTTGTATTATTATTRAGAPTGADWVTYQHDPARTGRTADGPGTTQIAQRWATPMGADVYAQPLVVGSQVIVATEADQVAALAAADGHVVWRTSIGTPVPRSALPCGDIDPSGVTSTPAVDRAAGIVWVAEETTSPAQPGQVHHDLVGLDLATGAIKSRRTIDPPGSDPAAQQIRAAVTLWGSTVYVPIGGLFGDCGAYRGYVVGVREDGTGGLAVWQVSDPGGGGGVWTTSGATVDDTGLLVATGNSRSTSSFADGNAVVRLTAGLQKTDEFAPTNWAGLSSTDTDLNSTGPAVVGDSVVQVGKEGVGYLLDRHHLGGIGGQVATAAVCTAFGGTAQLDGVVFEPCTSGLAAVSVGSRTLVRSWTAGGYDGGTPIVVGNVVWQIDVTNGRLLAYTAATGTRLTDVAVGPVHHFAPMAAGDGLLLVAGRDRILAFA